jgi:hypothetical protein
MPPYIGPTFQSVEHVHGGLKVHFTHTDGGLTVKGDKLGEFSVAGDDHKWHWADARIGCSVESRRHGSGARLRMRPFRKPAGSPMDNSGSVTLRQAVRKRSHSLVRDRARKTLWRADDFFLHQLAPAADFMAPAEMSHPSSSE